MRPHGPVMEGALLSIRIVTASAVVLLVSGMTAGGAAAQTATNETPGTPLQLLKIGEQPNKTNTKRHVKLLAHKTHSTVFARKPSRLPAQTVKADTPDSVSPAQTVKADTPDSVWPAQTVKADTPDSVWPAVNPAAPTEVIPQSTSTPGNLVPNELIVAGQTVQLASPADVNEIDLAANDAATPANDSAAPSGAAASSSAMNDISPAPPKSASPANPAAPPQVSQVGSGSWIAQVLAALGGAVAAGTVAWFLIGATPQRTFG
jgi:hypothetical protein